MRLLYLFVILGCLWLVHTDYVHQDESPDNSEAAMTSELTLYRKPNQQIRLLRRKKRFFWAIAAAVVVIGGIVMQRQQAEEAARRRERIRIIELEQLCHEICVTEWTSWSGCTKPCGGGTRRRSRRHQLPSKCSELSGFRCLKSTLQTEHCNQGCPNGGSPAPHGCKCQPGWKGTCCKIQVTCQYPGKPGNGQVVGGRWPAIYASVVTFSCNDGFYKEGVDMLRCQNTGQWNGNIPSCLQIKCPSPKESSHVSIMNRQTEYFYGDQIYYLCDDGYSMTGPPIRTCKKRSGAVGKWSQFDPICSAHNCGDPGVPAYGYKNGTNFRYGGLVTFSCATGYKLLGSQSMRCLAAGKWQGQLPECVQITCEPPIVPRNGAARVKRVHGFGNIVTFTCHPGFKLEGSGSLKCQANGHWNGTEPRCKASSCSDPGVPLNGAKDGTEYFFPHIVEFTCFTGYVLRGRKSISCQSNAQWSSPRPTCEACLLGFYMDAIESPGVCTKCPDNTYTLTTAASSRRQCLCKDKYMGPPGGPCTEIRCTKLYAPTNGHIDDCGTEVDETCSFTCIDGYVIDRGSCSRTCQKNANWEGAEPICSPCPQNTYKYGPAICLPCPRHSNTNNTKGNMEAGCVCDHGYQRDNNGSCIDINECLENGGKGPCEDQCDNRYGGYACSCSIPGYKLAEDLHSCKVANECRNLTKTDAPENGGLMCHWYHEQNSQYCGVRCNKGYELPARVNDYETCGPDTGFKWSFINGKANGVIPDCVPEFFLGFMSEKQIFYFTKNCHNLTEEDKQEVYARFKEVLDETKICKQRVGQVCDIKNMGLICGEKRQRRTKSGIVEEQSSVNIAFSLESVGIDPREDCPRICSFLRIRKRYCDRLCVPAYKRFMKAALINAQNELGKIYKSASLREKMNFQAAGREFESTGQINQTEVEIQCAPGMKADAMWCVPCEGGSFWNKTTKDCDLCPIGSYQPFTNQTRCYPCLPGSTTHQDGSYFCRLCKPGYYGEKCSNKCDCLNGTCNVQTGECSCHTGWSGERCDKDIDSCSESRCFPAVTCVDIPAPGLGFRCSSCPAGFRGDGVKCERISEL